MKDWENNDASIQSEIARNHRRPAGARRHGWHVSWRNYRRNYGQTGLCSLCALQPLCGQEPVQSVCCQEPVQSLCGQESVQSLRDQEIDRQSVQSVRCKESL
jgi:hypothetical protein